MPALCSSVSFRACIQGSAKSYHAELAQMVEHQTMVLIVTGSIPVLKFPFNGNRRL